MARRKLIDYRVYYIDDPENGYTDAMDRADVNHVPWREAQKLAADPPDTVVLIERVTRTWDYQNRETADLLDEELETVYEREGIDQD